MKIWSLVLLCACLTGCLDWGMALGGISLAGVGILRLGVGAAVRDQQAREEAAKARIRAGPSGERDRAVEDGGSVTDGSRSDGVYYSSP